MGGGHGDDEGEDVVDEGVEGLGHGGRNRPLGVTWGRLATCPGPVHSGPSRQSPPQPTCHVRRSLSERPEQTGEQVAAPDGPGRGGTTLRAACPGEGARGAARHVPETWRLPAQRPRAGH